METKFNPSMKLNYNIIYMYLMIFKRFVIVSKGFYSVVKSFPVFKDFNAVA